MPRILVRLVALVLVPALLADSAGASLATPHPMDRAHRSPDVWRPPLQFSSEALTASALWSVKTLLSPAKRAEIIREREQAMDWHTSGTWSAARRKQVAEQVVREHLRDPKVKFFRWNDLIKWPGWFNRFKFLTDGHTGAAKDMADYAVAYLKAQAATSGTVLGNSASPELPSYRGPSPEVLSSKFWQLWSWVDWHVFGGRVASVERIEQKRQTRLTTPPVYPQAQPTTEAVIAQIQSALQKLGIPDVRVMLYGSFADGRQNPWSDLDYAFLPHPSVVDQAFRSHLSGLHFVFTQANPISKSWWDVRALITEMFLSRDQSCVWVIGANEATRLDVKSPPEMLREIRAVAPNVGSDTHFDLVGAAIKIGVLTFLIVALGVVALYFMPNDMKAFVLEKLNALWHHERIWPRVLAGAAFFGVLGQMSGSLELSSYRGPSLTVMAVKLRSLERFLEQTSAWLDWTFIGGRRHFERRQKEKALRPLTSPPVYSGEPPVTGDVIARIQAALYRLNAPPHARVILIGSFADGRQGRWSDLDYYFPPDSPDQEYLRDQGRVFEKLLSGFAFDRESSSPITDDWHDVRLKIQDLYRSREQTFIWVIGPTEATRIELKTPSETLREIRAVVPNVGPEARFNLVRDALAAGTVMMLIIGALYVAGHLWLFALSRPWTLLTLFAGGVSVGVGVDSMERASLRVRAMVQTRSPQTERFSLSLQPMSDADRAALLRAIKAHHLIELDVHELEGGSLQAQFENVRGAFQSLAALIANDADISSAFQNKLDQNHMGIMLLELLKNAFVHGNAARFDLPIFLRVDVDAQEVDVMDAGLPAYHSVPVRTMMYRAFLSGRQLGVASIMKYWKYQLETLRDPVTFKGLIGHARASLEYIGGINRFDPSRNKPSRTHSTRSIPNGSRGPGASHGSDGAAHWFVRKLLPTLGFATPQALHEDGDFLEMALSLGWTAASTAMQFVYWGTGVSFVRDEVAELFGQFVLEASRRSQRQPGADHTSSLNQIRDWLRIQNDGVTRGLDAQFTPNRVQILTGLDQADARLLIFEVVDNPGAKVEAHYVPLPPRDGIPVYHIQVQASVFKNGRMNEVLWHEFAETAWRAVGASEEDADRMARERRPLSQTSLSAYQADPRDLAPYGPGAQRDVTPISVTSEKFLDMLTLGLESPSALPETGHFIYSEEVSWQNIVKRAQVNDLAFHLYITSLPELDKPVVQVIVISSAKDTPREDIISAFQLFPRLNPRPEDFETVAVEFMPSIQGKIQAHRAVQESTVYGPINHAFEKQSALPMINAGLPSINSEFYYLHLGMLAWVCQRQWSALGLIAAANKQFKTIDKGLARDTFQKILSGLELTPGKTAVKNMATFLELKFKWTSWITTLADPVTTSASQPAVPKTPLAGTKPEAQREARSAWTPCLVPWEAGKLQYRIDPGLVVKMAEQNVLVSDLRRELSAWISNSISRMKSVSNGENLVFQDFFEKRRPDILTQSWTIRIGRGVAVDPSKAKYLQPTDRVFLVKVEAATSAHPAVLRADKETLPPILRPSHNNHLRSAA